MLMKLVSFLACYDIEALQLLHLKHWTIAVSMGPVWPVVFLWKYMEHAG